MKDRSTELRLSNYTQYMPATLARSFRNAFSGISYVLRTQRNARIHLGITLVVLVLGVWLELDIEQWIALIIVAGFVWTAEFINTALEAAVDLSSPHEQPLAGIAKDVSAGAVLVAASTAVVVGILILGPALVSRLFAS